MIALFGTAFCCAALVVLTLRNLREPGAALRLAGGLLYLFVVGLTIAYHVRRTTHAALTPTSSEAIRYWQVYLSEWTSWNHMRTAASLAAAILLILAYRMS